MENLSPWNKNLWFTELNADIDDAFRQRYLCDIPKYEPPRRGCWFCGGVQEQNEHHVWNCTNPDCKSHEMIARIDRSIRRIP